MRDLNMTEADTDDRPIALRRKRRASSSALKSPAKPRQNPGGVPEVDGSEIKSALASESKTPRPKKRVRFSYPPDAAAGLDTGAEDHQSTGITPFVARTTLLENQSACIDNQPSRLSGGFLRRPPRRRRSTNGVQIGHDDSLQLSSRNLDTQLPPLSTDQALSERSKRRLMRSHVSEVMNTLEAEQRRHRLQEQELLRVKREVEDLKAGRVAGGSSSERVQSLENEIVRLKEQLREMETQALSSLHQGDLATAQESAPSTATSTGFENAEYHRNVDQMPLTPLTPMSYVSSSTSPPDTPCTNTSVQTELTAMSIDKLHSHFKSQVNVLTTARMELERIIPGETPLPLSSPTETIALWKGSPTPTEGFLGGAAQNLVLADAEPLFNAVLRHIRLMKHRVTQATKDLATSEAQRISVVGNFNTALNQLEEARHARAKLIAESQTRQKPAIQTASNQSSERRRITDEDVKACELEEATAQLKQLQEKVITYERDRSSLVTALNKYREEIKDMECLIGTLETEHSFAIKDLKDTESKRLESLIAEHAQAVDDLEVRVSSEARGRREAEAELDKVMVRWASQREKGERELGLLNIKLADLDETVKMRDDEVGSLHQELSELQEHVKCFVGGLGMGSNVLAFDDTPRTPVEEPSLPQNMADAGSIHLKQPSRVGKWGLLTPRIEGGRFRDAASTTIPDLSSDASMCGESIPGDVELGRGKRSRGCQPRDSGIGTLSEVENEA